MFWCTMLWTRYFCKIMHINIFICFHKRRGQPWLLSCLNTGCFLAVALRSACVLGTLVSLFLYECEMNSCPSFLFLVLCRSSLQKPGFGWCVAHLQTAWADYWAKQSAHALCFHLISQLSLQQFSLVPRMSRGCSVCHLHCVLTCFGCSSSHRANSRLVPNVVTSRSSLEVRFVGLKYNTSNLAPNVHSHVSHLTLRGPSDIRTLAKNIKCFLHQTCNFHCIWWCGKQKCRVSFT